MAPSIYIEKPEKFNFRQTVRSHGWYDLAPFEYDKDKFTLTYVFSGNDSASPVTGSISERSGKICVEVPAAGVDKESIRRDVRHILRLDDEMDLFYAELSLEPRLAWVSESHAGRLLRSPTVYEDLVKTMCTTNCSWSLTRKMVANLVEKLGEAASDGRRAFPTPEAMTSVDESFYRNEIKAGYRSPYFVALAKRIAEGELDPESWLTSPLPTPVLKKEIKNIKGFGDYAAENLLKLLGRYDGLTLDSWLRARFYSVHNDGKKCDDKKIELHYSKYGEWRGLAIWCDMTEDWFNVKD